MVEINNQRKAFLDMLAWSEGTDNGRPENRNHGYDVIVGRLFTTGLLRYANLTALNPKLKSTGAGHYRLLSRWWDAYHKQRPERLLSEKSGRCGVQQIKGMARCLWLIVVMSVGQSTVAAISGLHCRALVMVSSGIRLTAWLQIQRSGRNGRRWCKGRVTAIISALVICIIVCLSWAVNHYRDNAITKPSATKMPENWSWRTRQLLTCRCVSVMLLRSMQNTRRS